MRHQYESPKGTLFAPQSSATAPKPGQVCPTCSLVVPAQPRLKAGRDHPGTAHAAAKSADKALDARSTTVIDYLLTEGARGMTDDEIDAMTGWGHQCTTPVMHSLRAARLVAWKFGQDGKYVTRPTRKGNAARVNVLARYAVCAAGEAKPCGD